MKAANENPEVPNPDLREHVTSHSFVLTLHKTQIVTLQEICEDREWRRNPHFVSSVRGLQTRGLVIHHHPSEFSHAEQRRFGQKDYTLTQYYEVTPAGWAAYLLLAEAGLIIAKYDIFKKFKRPKHHDRKFA